MTLDKRFTTAPGNIEFSIPLDEANEPAPGKTKPAMTMSITAPVMLATLGALKVLTETEDDIIANMMHIATQRILQDPSLVPDNQEYTALRDAAQRGVNILELDDDDVLEDEFMNFLEHDEKWKTVQVIVPINDYKVYLEITIPGFKSYWLLMKAIKDQDLEALLLNQIETQE